MKKRIAAILALCIIFTLAACGKKAPEPTPAPTPVPTAASAPTPAPTPDPTPVQTPEPLPIQPDLPAVHDEALNQIFEAVLGVYPGSAGSSLRAGRSGFGPRRSPRRSSLWPSRRSPPLRSPQASPPFPSRRTVA